MSTIFISIKHIINRKRQAISATLGVSISFVLLIISSGIFNGFHEKLVNGFTASSSHIELYKSYSMITNYKEIINEIENIKEISYVTPLLEDFALIKHNSKDGLFLQGGFIKGIDPDNRNTLLNNKIIKGNFNLKNNGIILGKELANNLDIEIGSQIDLISSNKSSNDFNVSGVVDFGLESLNKKIAYISINDMQTILNEEGKSEKILVNLSDFEKTKKVAAILNKITNLNYTTWYEINRNFLFDISLQKTVSNILFFLILLISGFTIAIILSTSVREKTNDIGILRACGISKNSILKIFIFEGVILGGAGILFGIIMSFIIYKIINSNILTFSISVYKMENIPFLLKQQDIFVTFILIVSVILVSSLYPAIKASKLEPIKAIRQD